MILFKFDTPAEKARIRVMRRPEESPLFSPTRHGADFLPQFDESEPERRNRFEHGIPQAEEAEKGSGTCQDGARHVPDPFSAPLADIAQAKDVDAPQQDDAANPLGPAEGMAETLPEPEPDPEIEPEIETAAVDVAAEGGPGVAEALTEELDAGTGSGTCLAPSWHVPDPVPDLEEIRKEAFEAGFAAALAEAAQAEPQVDPGAEDAAYLRGLEEGQQQTKDELEAEVLLAADDLKALANQLAQAARDTDSFYQPLLKLSMHLAEQLVRGELTLSGQAVTRLVERCLNELQQATDAPILVRMHPVDHERHLAYGAMAPKNMELRADPSLSQGSVKVSMNGASIEDLIEHRRQVLWETLMSPARASSREDLPDSFLRNVAIVKEAMASVDDEDAEPPAV
jgi:flagellar biosynthesis/type III secretory pathway protein FliH